MKTLKTSIQTLTALLIAVVALTACSSDDNAINEPTVTTETPKVYTLSVEAMKGDAATTRALSIDGKTLNATWAVDDKVQVYHVTNPGTVSEMESTTPDATLTAKGSGATTTLTGSFTGSYKPAAGDVLRLRFLPKPDYTNQEGTLDYIASHCDYATADMTITEVTGYEAATTVAEFENQQAIVKFSLKQPDGTTHLAAMRLTVKVGSTAYNVTPPAASSDIYVAVRRASGKDVTLTAINTDGDSYSYSRSGVTFETGKYYAIGVKMTEDHPYTATVDLSTLTADYIVPDYTILTGTLSGGHKITIADGATVKLRDVTIPGDNDDGKPWAGITCQGNATIRLSGTNSVKGYHHYYAGIQAGPSGTTLTIEGGGKLTAICGGGDTGNYAAGIGGGREQTVGNIVIKGGDITAEGGNAAGIGSGYPVTAEAVCGDITISGGIVSAKSIGSGAGIGSGKGTGKIISSCGNITISGGTVTATGRLGGAGIGSGESASGSGGARCGNITITGGTITAKGGSFTAGTLKLGAAGIGTGNQAWCGSITISGKATGTATHGENNNNTCYDIGTGYLGKLTGTISIAPSTISGTYPE